MRSISIISFVLLVLFACSNPPVVQQKENEIKTDSLQNEEQAQIKAQGDCNCETTVYLNDPDTNGTNVRDEPNGNIIKKLKYEPDCGCLIVEISSSKNNWLQLKNGGWVHAPLFAVASRNYGENNILYLNESPSNESKTVAEYKDEQQFTVLGCSSTWLLVKGKDGKKGWLSAEMQCPNPLTTCP